MNCAAGRSCAAGPGALPPPARVGMVVSATCLACGAYERANLVRVLVTGRALDAGGDVDAGRPGDAQRLPDVLRIQPAGKHERNRGIEVLEQVPVEALAQPARPGRIARRARVEQQP